MHAGPEVTVAFILCFTLAVGAAMRALSVRTHIPYTIGMLLIGMAVGLILEQLPGSRDHSGVLSAVTARGAISPDLIVFIFLPLLVFESAFTLEIHSFRKNLGSVLTLAGPAMLVSTAAIGLLMVALTRSSWQWGVMEALVFGSLISATDPVAVVALLRETGAPKRLRLLIEGESLLNDGTAIVLFGVILGLLTGAFRFEAGDTLLHFARVTLGGLAVGLVLAIAVTAWLSRTFNAPLVEITLTLVLAYGAMLVAEALLHVSGVIAVVTAGLWMAGRGRLQVSPEVSHFLHRFWEMLAYLANTLIFFLVGLVIATQLGDARLADLLLIGVAFGGIVSVRFGLVFLFRPLMNRVADPVGHKEAAVIAWGGLRGAVSLALALVVSQHPDVAPELGRQILLTTAGVVLLTIVVNGSTVPLLLRWFGLDRSPASDRLAETMTRASVLERVEERVATVSGARDLRAVDWGEVRRDLEDRREEVQHEIASTRSELESASALERSRGYWRQALGIEREAYWAAFARGTLGDTATEILDHEIDVELDELARGKERPRTRRWHDLAGWRIPLVQLARRLSRLSRVFGRLQTQMLALRYDLYRGAQLAAERVLDEVSANQEMDEDVRDRILESYRQTLHASKERLEDLRANLPEVVQAIETRLARRIQLNLEREDYRRLRQSGAIDAETAVRELARVERRMKALRWAAAEELTLPGTSELCRKTPLFADFDAAALEQVAAATTERVLAPGEVLFRQGEPGDRMFIIARGAAAVTRADARRGGEPALIDVLGGGDVLGEMALLTGSPRNATVRAVTTVTGGEISRQDFDRLMAAQPRLRDRVWRSFAERRFDNRLGKLRGYEHLDHAGRLAWFRSGEMLVLETGESLPSHGSGFAFVVAGSLERDLRRYREDALVSLHADAPLRATERTRVAVVPPLLESDPVSPTEHPATSLRRA
ncbi:MAG: cation:proton antiporter [Deltaproteobacteria bacterium]|nr:cation:proton antiporter [Deltaproteobacteria bacterium]